MFLNLLCPLSFGSGEVFHSHFLMIEHWLRVRLIINVDIKCATAETKITKSAVFSLLPSQSDHDTMTYLQD